MLSLYRRHYDKGRCIGGHKPNTQTYESDELRPKHKKCGCPIYASGRVGDNAHFRKNTRRFTWPEARAAAEMWERHGVDAPPPPAPASPTHPTGKPRRAIADAAGITLTECMDEEASLATQRRYKGWLKKFRTYGMDMKGYVYLDEWTPEAVAEYRVWWKGSVRYKRQYFSFLRSFFEAHRKFITENPVEKPPRSRNRKQQAALQPKDKSPFTDAELNRMLAACQRYPVSGYPQKFFGEDVSDFILISAYTGLRISDVATFHTDRMTADGDIHFRAIKNGKWVDTWVPEFIQEIVRKRAEKWGPYIFGARKTEDPVVLGGTWR